MSRGSVQFRFYMISSAMDSEILDASPKLQTIYEFKQRLQGVWAKRSAGAEELLNELKAWCCDAEATGIQSLQSFVAEIRSYTMPQLARA